jgi:hypothetical protein
MHAALAAIAPPVIQTTPPVLFLRRGFVPPDAPHFVQFVDEDASGELRLIEETPESPVSRPNPCGGRHS